MEVLVNVEGIVGFIEGAVARLAAQPALDLRHQWEEVSRVARVEGLSEFGQDDLAPLRHFGGDDAGSIPPVILADTDLTGGPGVRRLMHIDIGNGQPLTT
jgi:hypothetical protein